MSLNTYPYNPFPASTDKLDEAHNAELQQEVDQLKEDTGELQEDVEKLETDKTDTAVIAPEFDAEAGVYVVGDLVMYQGKLYEFTTAHETAGEWNSEEVTEKTVADEVDTLKSGLTNITPTLVYTSPTTGTYGDKLAGVKTAFNNLSSEKKKIAYIVLGGSTKYPVGNWNIGIFNSTYYDPDNSSFKFVSIDLSKTGDGLFERLTVSTSGNVIESRVNTENSNTFALYA